jgi:Flp pilus assembly protein TadG
MKVKNAKAQAGVALIEFALVLPILMMVLMGLVELGRVTYFSIEVANAAHAGAQYGALSYPNVQGTNMGIAAADDGRNSISNLNTSGHYVCGCWNPVTGTETPATPTLDACSQPCASGGHIVTYAQVTVTGTIHSLLNYTAIGLPDHWDVTRVATMRVIQAQ